MVEPRSLPQFGSKNQSFIAGAGNGSGRNKCGDVHVGIWNPPATDRPSHAVSHLRADGQNGPRLAMGIRSMLSGLMSHRHSNSRVLQAETGHNARVDLRVVPVVSQLSAGAGLASGRNRVRNVDGTGNVDAVSHSTITLMPFSLLIKMIPLAGVMGSFLSFVEGGRAVDILLSGIVGAGGFAGFVGAIKYFIDRADKRRADLLALSRTDSQFSLERERLLDSQTVALMKQAEEFYSIRDKEKQGIIELQRTTIEQKNQMIDQLQIQVAALLAQLQRGKP